MVSRLRGLLSALLLVAFVGCGGGGGGETSDGGEEVGEEAGSDATGDIVDGDGETGVDGETGADGDAGVDGETGEADVIDEPDPQPEPTYTQEAVDLGDWWVTTVSMNQDPVRGAIADGSFEVPTEKGFYLDTFWKSATPGPEGIFDAPKGGIMLYAVKKHVFEQNMRLVARVEPAYDVRIGSLRQPGDVYKSGRHRVPFQVSAGEHVVMVRGTGGKGAVQAQFSRMSDEIAFNPADLLAPSLPSGESEVAPLGIPVLNLIGTSALDVTARVLESDHVLATENSHPSLPGGASTQLVFLLDPKGSWPEAGTPLTVELEVVSPGLEWPYRHTVELTTVDGSPEATGPFRRTFISGMDQSVQFFGERRPASVDAEASYGLALSLHGAGVNAHNLAGDYSSKDWAYVAAATNRRRFGFDWQAWGRRDAIEVLEHVMAHRGIDPTRVHLTGHSMGGHGTWHVGTLFPDRFAVIGPSAGWVSFETYGGATPSTGPFGWAESHFDPRDFIENLVGHGVYLIHGTADDNVPIAQGEIMYASAEPHVEELHFHKEEGAGHWWNGDASEGVDCVDWPPLFELMQERSLDPAELDFKFTAPQPWVNPRHSYVTIRSQNTPTSLSVLESFSEGTLVTLTTTNVRSMTLNGDMLVAKGIEAVLVDGESVAVAEGPLPVGPQTGKTENQSGPFNQVMHSPWCWVVPDDPGALETIYAGYLASTWNIIGNGTSCVVRLGEVTDALRESRNLIHVGIPSDSVEIPESIPVQFGATGISLNGQGHVNAAIAFVYPDGDRLGAVMYATPGSEDLLYGVMPFSSRFVVPDFLIWKDGGSVTTGFFDAEWGWDSALVNP